MNLASCKLKQYTASVLKKSNTGLTPEQFLLMDILWNQGKMSQQKLADNMHKDKNSITKLVDALETKGLIMRQRDADDRRSNIVVPTPKGEAMKEETKEKAINMMDAILDGISEEELRSFLDTLSKLSKNMDAKF